MKIFSFPKTGVKLGAALGFIFRLESTEEIYELEASRLLCELALITG
jgi:hypothetical protein